MASPSAPEKNENSSSILELENDSQELRNALLW